MDMWFHICVLSCGNWCLYLYDLLECDLFSLPVAVCVLFAVKKSVGSFGIQVGEELIHLQLLYFKASEFHLHSLGKE